MLPGSRHCQLLPQQPRAACSSLLGALLEGALALKQHSKWEREEARCRGRGGPAGKLQARGVQPGIQNAAHWSCWEWLLQLYFRLLFEIPQLPAGKSVVLWLSVIPSERQDSMDISRALAELLGVAGLEQGWFPVASRCWWLRAQPPPMLWRKRSTLRQLCPNGVTAGCCLWPFSLTAASGLEQHLWTGYAPLQDGSMEKRRWFVQIMPKPCYC